MTNPQIPRLHMGCGEALRSQWLVSLARNERKPLATMPKSKAGATQRERTRG